MNANRRIALAFVLSVAAHALLFAVLPAKHLPEPLAATQVPMTVEIRHAEQPAPPVSAPPPPEPVAVPAPPPRPVPTVKPRERAPPVPPTTVAPVAPPAPLPEPRAPPLVDMAAIINARRERRRALEAAAAAREMVPGREATPDESALAAIQRNLGSAPGVGVSGVFEILRKGTRTAEFAFNGWRPDSQRKWREVIEVDAGVGGDVERAIVRRMIELIRSHYSGDFNWESHRLGRIVVLSARPEDNDGLEDFLVREFFGTPTINRAR